MTNYLGQFYTNFMKKKLFSASCWLFFIFFSPPLQAILINNLYTAAINVATQKKEDKNLAIQEGLINVLVKVSGAKKENIDKAFKETLPHAGDYLEEFSYSTTNVKGAKSYLLLLRFDNQAINRLLTNASFPVWGAYRPLILVLADLNTITGSDKLVLNDNNNTFTKSLKERAMARGLPIIFPIMDIADLNIISLQNIKTLNSENLQDTLKRYASDALLVGYVNETANQHYSSSWKLILKQQIFNWSFESSDLNDLAFNLIDHFASELATRYATILNQNKELIISLIINHVNNANDLHALLNYLKHLTVVSHVEIMQIAQDNVTLKLIIRGEQNNFLQAISVGQKLIPVANTKHPLTYEWNN